ncbi:MAG: phenylalanine--tRNA ligase beta subunit-related protein [Planctomycetota bacterium]
MLQIHVKEHPLLDAAGVVIELPGPQGEESPPWLQEMISPDFPCEPMTEELRKAVRSLLRHGGYRPAGRGKPSSEWLQKAAAEGKLTSIFPLVDLGNSASRISGLPLSVVDLDRVEGELSIGLGESGQKYVFNASGQEIDIAGLVCLGDSLGPCANAVKDSQRTKTDPQTRRCLIQLWGTLEAPEVTRRLLKQVSEAGERLGGRLEGVEFLPQ